MLIDWLTVAAQIFNFLVLVFLLKHFLYKPLVSAVDEREKKIAGCLAEADAKSKEAETLVELERARALEQERRRDEMLAEAKREAGQVREQMIQQARIEVRRLESEWREDLEQEQGAFLDELRRRSAKEITMAVRRALADLASSNLQHAAIEVLLEKLRSLDAAALNALADGDLSVLTSGDLADDGRQQIREAIETRLGRPVPLRFVRASELGWGIELRGHGRRIGWNSETYAENLEERLREVLERRAEKVVT